MTHTCSLHFCWSCFHWIYICLLHPPLNCDCTLCILSCCQLIAIDFAKAIFFFPPEDWIACCFRRGFEVKCSNISIAVSGLGVKFLSAISSLTFLKIEMTLGSLLCLQKTSAFHSTVVAYYKYFLWCVSLLHSLPPSPFPAWRTVPFLFLPHRGCLSAAQSWEAVPFSM